MKPFHGMTPQQQHPQQPQQHLGSPPGRAPPQPDRPLPPDEHIPNRPEVPALGIPAQANPICAPVQPPAEPQAGVIDQCATELAALRAHIAQLERDADGAPPRPATPPCYVPPVLFTDQDTIDRARAAAVASRDSDRKLSLPEIIPGFKASPLDIHEYQPFVFYSHHLFGALLHPAIGHTEWVKPSFWR